jgi:hypothetical protein
LQGDIVCPRSPDRPSSLALALEQIVARATDNVLYLNMYLKPNPVCQQALSPLRFCPLSVFPFSDLSLACLFPFGSGSEAGHCSLTLGLPSAMARRVAPLHTRATMRAPRPPDTSIVCSAVCGVEQHPRRSCAGLNELTSRETVQAPLQKIGSELSIENLVASIFPFGSHPGPFIPHVTPCHRNAINFPVPFWRMSALSEMPLYGRRKSHMRFAGGPY